jgi:hypothetical protein
MILTKRDRNQIYETIVTLKLDPAEFDLEDNGKKVVITHNSGSTFKFDAPTDLITGGTYFFRAMVPNVVDKQAAARGINNLLAGEIYRWLDTIRLTVGTPDYWEEMRSRRELIANIEQADTDNTPFTENEQRQIVTRLQEIKNQVREQFELTGEQMEHIEEQLDEAAEASKRMGRKDWLIYLLGTVTALIITATVTAGVGEHIFSMVIHALGHLFTGGNEPPQIPPPVIT